MPSPILDSDPKKLRVLKKLCNLLEATSGYEGIPVSRGTLVVSAKDVQDTLSILEAPRPVDGQPAAEEGRKRLGPWVLLLQGWPKDDKDNPSDPAYYLAAAVIKQLNRIIDVDDRSGLGKYPEYLLDGDIASMIIGQDVVRPPSQEAASRLAMFYIPLTIELITDTRNPAGR